MKHTLLASALVAVLISYGAAQDLSSELNASLDPEPARATNLASPSRRAPGPPSYCKPCLFYAGDFDSNASDANGLPNEVDIIVSTGAATYTPFIVPKGKTWKITGLFTNDFLLPIDVLDPARSPYEVRQGIPAAGGNGGKLVCHGNLKATATPSGPCCDLYIYAVAVKGIKGCILKSGKYWMSVIPYCNNPNDNSCTSSWRGFLANDDGAMNHRFGPLEPANDSFFNSVFFGANWDPSSKFQSSKRFSVGVEGTSN